MPQTRWRKGCKPCADYSRRFYRQNAFLVLLLPHLKLRPKRIVVRDHKGDNLLAEITVGQHFAHNPSLKAQTPHAIR